MRCGSVIGGALLALAFASGPLAGVADASCVGPYIDDQPSGGAFGATPPTVAPGGRITVYGHWYTSTCNDTGQDEPYVALDPVQVRLVLPDGAVQEVGTFEPQGEDLGFRTTIEIPADAPSGTATVDDGLDAGSDYTFDIDPAGVRDATIDPVIDHTATVGESDDDGVPTWALAAVPLLLLACWLLLVLRRGAGRTR